MYRDRFNSINAFIYFLGDEVIAELTASKPRADTVTPKDITTPTSSSRKE